MNTKILICCHKKSELPNDDFYLPIHVGAALSDVDLHIQPDNQVNGIECENISNKNKSFCELTAIYWAWKNIRKLYPNIEYIGLCHYRRFFANINKILSKLNTKKVIIPKFWYTPYSCENAYKVAHPCVDFDILRGVVSEKYPDYVKSFEDVLTYSNRNSVYNMFIMPINIFEQYCTWLFNILYEVEKRVHLDSYDLYQKRIFGFMAERLLLVYLVHNKIKYNNVNVICPEEQKILKSFVNNIRFNIAFFFGKKRK